MHYEMLLNVSIHLQCEGQMEKVFFFSRTFLQKLFYYSAERTDFSYFIKK